MEHQIFRFPKFLRWCCVKGAALGSLAELLRFEVSQNSFVFKLADRQIDRYIDRQTDNR